LLKKRNSAFSVLIIIIATLLFVTLALNTASPPYASPTEKEEGGSRETLATSLELVEPDPDGMLYIRESEFPIELKVKAEYVNNADETEPADNCLIKLTIAAVDVVRSHQEERRTDDDGFVVFTLTEGLRDSTYGTDFPDGEIRIRFTMEEQESGSFTLA